MRNSEENSNRMLTRNRIRSKDHLLTIRFMVQRVGVFLLLILVCSMTGCGNQQPKMKDGFYTAEMSDYSHGWKEYVCIMVKNDKIVSVEFNAKNQSGYIKAWDNAYMNNMLPIAGTYPNEYTRYYAAKLVGQQDSESIDALTGATNSGNNFIRLSAAVIEQARKGKAETAVVAMEY